MNNDQKVHWQEEIQQKAGLECSDIGLQQSFNMGISQQNKNLQPAKPSTPILSRFESPVSAFYTTERFMEFPQHDFQAKNPYLCPQYMNTSAQTHSSNYSSGESSFIESTEQAQLQSKDTLQSFVKCHCYGDQNKKCSQKSSKIPYRNINPGNKFLQFQRGRLLEGDDAYVTGKQLTVPSEGFQDNRLMQVPCSSSSSSFARPGFSSQQEKKSPSFPGKTRIRWTQDLHQKFVESVNCLGGAEKATPKAILKQMDTDGLTIFHVKSHLQKFRTAKYMPDSTEGKSEKSRSMNDSLKLDLKSGLQIKEALQLQVDVQRQLHEQLELQRNLQLRIEEQGKKLQMMFELQQKQEQPVKYSRFRHCVVVGSRSSI